MIRELDEQQSYELLTTTTIGRIGFIEDGRVQIQPMNFALSARELLLRTSADSALGILTVDPIDAAFEVDYHDPLGGTAWSVLLRGSLARALEDQAADIIGRVSPWAGGNRDLPLVLTIESIEGRVVRREPVGGTAV